MNSKWVYAFIEGDGKNKKLLGGKGANLCEMTQIGLNVPPGFVITTEACLAYLDDPEHRLPAGRARPGAPPHGRGGAGHGQDLRRPRQPPAGLGAFRVGHVHAGHDGHHPQPGPQPRHPAGPDRPNRQRALRLRRLPALHPAVRQSRAGRARGRVRQRVQCGQGRCRRQARRGTVRRPSGRHRERFLKVVERVTGKPFPADPYEQLEIAIKAVFNSWGGKRAVDYRREFNITPEMANGTAVNVVAMVFGNMGDDSATGVGFTRNPGTGENVMFGEYLVNAQGEDVVAGIRTPKPVAELEKEMPDLYRQLVELQEPAGIALQGSAGLRVHHRTRHPVLPADPQRQDERHRPGAHLGGDGQRWPDRPDPGAAAHPAGIAGTAAVPAPGPEDQGQACRQGPARLARRGLRRLRCSTPTAPRSWAAPEKR